MHPPPPPPPPPRKILLFRRSEINLSGHCRHVRSEMTVGVLLPCLHKYIAQPARLPAMSHGQFLYDKRWGTLMPGTTVTCKHSS